MFEKDRNTRASFELLFFLRSRTTGVKSKKKKKKMYQKRVIHHIDVISSSHRDIVGVWINHVTALPHRGCGWGLRMSRDSKPRDLRDARKMICGR
jgi:hypothetical protein